MTPPGPAATLRACRTSTSPRPASTPTSAVSGPFGLSYWPLPEDDPGVELRRESIRLVSPDGALVRGLLWLPPAGRPWKTAVILSHPRGDFSVHYACPLLAAAGYAVLGFGTRYMGNDTDCLHEACIVDVKTVHDEMRRRGAEAVVLLGNSGGGSLMALAQAELGIGDGWVGHGRPPGRGRVHAAGDRPLGGRRADPFRAACPSSTCTTPTTAGARGPSPAPTTGTGSPGTGPRRSSGSPGSTRWPRPRWPTARTRAPRLAGVDKTADPRRWRDLRTRTVAMRYLTIYRTLADPAYLDLSIDPDERPLGQPLRLPRPARRELWPRRPGPHDDRAGLAVDVVRACRAHAKLADTMPQVPVPTLLVHPTADTEIRVRQANEIVANAGADDVTYVEMKGAPHYLEGHRPQALSHVAEWMAARFP